MNTPDTAPAIHYKLYAWPYNYEARRSCIHSKTPIEIKASSEIEAMEMANKTLYLHDAVVWKLYKVDDENHPVKEWRSLDLKPWPMSTPA